MSVKRNTAYNLAGALLPLLAIYLTLPLYLSTIGEARYGVLAIVWTLLGYFGLFDLGLGRAVTNRIAAYGDRPPGERSRVFWTALFINVGLGTLASMIVWAVGDVVLTRFLDASDQLVLEVREALPWISLCLPALLASSVMSGALMGREDFLSQNGVRGVEGVLIQVLPLLAALYVGATVAPIVLAVLLVRLVATVVLFVLCIVRLPVTLRPGFDRSEARDLTVFGGWVTVTSIIGPVLSTLDRVILGAVSGMRAVTYYTVPFGLVSRLSIIPGSLSSALFPRFSAETQELGQQRLQERAVRALAVVLMPMVVLGVLVMDPFLAWWVDAAFANNAALAGEILLLGIWANCLAYVPFARLQGAGRPDLVAKIHAAEVVPYLLILWLALAQWGVVGAAAAWTLRSAIDAALLFRVSRFGPAALRSLLVPTICIGVAFLLVVSVERAAPLRWILSAIPAGIGLVWAWYAAPPELRHLVRPDRPLPVPGDADSG